MTDLTKYLIRREMVRLGLLKFDDYPENYWAGKTSFQDITRELGPQEHWITHDSKCKEEHSVSFPPFSFFASFVCSQAKTQNDPIFPLSPSNNVSHVRSDKTCKVQQQLQDSDSKED